MPVENWLKGSLLVPGLCLALLPVLAQQQSSTQSGQQGEDPVAEAARKAREQKKEHPKPKKIYTDDDIKPATNSTDAGAANSNQPAQSGNDAQPAQGGDQGAAANGPAGGKQDEESSWRKRFADQRGKIVAAEKELDIMQRELNKSQVQYYNDPQKALQEQYSRKDINDQNAKLDAKKQEIANLKQQLSDLEDELRKAGGDPGWAREP